MAIAIAVLVGCAAALSDCGTDSTTGPRGEGPLKVLYDRIFIADAGDSLTLSRDMDSVLVFDMKRGTPKIVPNTIVIGTRNGGYIRRVRSTRVEGKRLFISCSPAFLTDAVICGRIDTTLALGFNSSALGGSGSGGATALDLVDAAPGVHVSEGGLNLAGVTLHPAGDSADADLTVTITNGRIELDPALDLFAEVNLRDVVRFNAIFTGDLSFTCDASVEAQEPLCRAVSFEAPIASVRRTAIQHVGSVPVVEVVTMSYVAGVVINAGYAGTTAIGLDASGRIQCGMRYEHRAWSSANGVPPQLGAHPFSYQSGGEASIELYVAPLVRVDFYGLPCVRMELGPSFGLSEQEAGFPVLEWELWADMRGRSSFEPGAVDGAVVAYDNFQRCCKVSLDAGPFRTNDYIFVRQWGNESVTWEGTLHYPKGIAVDRAGDIYVTDNWSNTILKFTAEGAFVRSWGGAGSGDGELDSPEKIAVDEEGYVYVADSGNNRVEKFTADGAFVAAWGSEGGNDGEFRSPVGIAASGGDVYVADGGNHRVERFSTSGAFLGAWGSYGSAPGQFDGPTGLTIEPGGGILVADCHNDRIQRFSRDGTYLASWGAQGTGDGQFDCAVDVTAASGGDVFAADLGNDRFARFAPDGAFETKLGARGTAPGQFDHPEAVAVDGRGYVYVVDSRNGRIQEFAPRIASRSAFGVVTGLIPN